MRNKRLDVLRCIAILLVIGHHAQTFPVWTRTGWVGVDLFFVLSGFLISGLLYSEYKKRQNISVGRFFIRRGLKIYPAFYFFLAATLAAQLLLYKGSVPLKPYLYEMLFIQNYHFAIWQHTWSLAVEEHFYIALALLLLALVRFLPALAESFRNHSSAIRLRSLRLHLAARSYNLARSAVAFQHSFGDERHALPD